NGTPFQFVSTHLDPTGVKNQDQIQEILNLLSGPSALQIVVGDFNTQDIHLMTDAGFVETTAALGNTCCRDPDLNDPTSELTSQIDFIFERNFDSVLSASLIDTHFEDRPQWPSDHAGLIASVSVPTPGTLLLFVSGLGGLGAMGFWRRRKQP